MKLGTFKGGIHPNEGKDMSKDLPVKTVLPKGELVYPMSQHAGPILDGNNRVQGTSVSSCINKET